MSNSIALPVAELKSALTGLGKIIAKRPTLPVLGHLKIERTTDGWIALTVSDLDHFITVRLEQPDAGEAVTILVPFDELQKITKNSQKNEKILISSCKKASEASVTIQYAVGSQVAETTVETLPPAEFPACPSFSGEPVTIEEKLRESIQEAFECASTDESRLILNGAYIDVSHQDGHYIVGTNGSALFSSNSFKLPLKDSLILPSHKFLDYREFNNDGDWRLSIAEPQHKDDQRWLQFSSRRWQFTTKQYEGNYPNWRQVIPEESSFKTSILFSVPEALADTIERLPDHDPLYHAIGIERSSNTVSLLWKSDKEQPWKRLEVDHERVKGQDSQVFVNRRYLIKALRFGLGRLQFNGSGSAMRFSQDGRQMIVMPVRTEVTTAAQPATTPEPPEPTMVKDNTESPAEPLTIDAQLDQLLEEIEAMKDTVQDHLTGLKSLGSKLKGIQREHKASNKELHTIRQTIKGLQGVKL